MRTLFMISMLCTLFVSCTTTSNQLKVLNNDLSNKNLKTKTMLLTPITKEYENKVFAKTLGDFMFLELSKQVKSELLYSENIPSLKELISWDNIIKNGMVNIPELQTIAKTFKCQSFVIIQLLEVNKFSPFRCVKILTWVNTEDGKTLSKIYFDADLRVGEVKRSFRKYIEQNDEYLTDKVFTNDERFQTSYLKPESFMRFVAYQSIQTIFEKFETRWYEYLYKPFMKDDNE